MNRLGDDEQADEGREGRILPALAVAPWSVYIKEPAVSRRNLDEHSDWL